MKRMGTIMLALVLAACGTGTAQEDRSDRDTGQPLAAPVTGPSAYVILATTDIDRGWDLLEAMDTELPPPQRAKIQARGLVSGRSRSMMIRFLGECADNGGFVAAVQSVAERHGVQKVRCASALPEG